MACDWGVFIGAVLAPVSAAAEDRNQNGVF